MTGVTIPDVTYSIDGNFIQLNQRNSDDLFILHRIHFAHICQELGLPTLDPLSQVLARRLLMVSARISQLADDASYREEIVTRCGCGVEILTELDSVATLADEFCKDIGTG